MSLQAVSVDKALMKAKLLTKKGNLNEAKDIYKNVLIRFPKNIRALKALQVLSKEKNNIIETSLPQITFDQLVNLNKQGKFNDLLNLTLELFTKYPNDFFIYHMNGVANKALDNYENALNSFNKVISLNPNFIKAFFQIGNIYKIQGKFKEAINIFEKLLLIDNQYIYAYNNIGQVLQGLGKLDEAINNYKKALSINPNYANAYNNLGTALKEQNKLDDAIDAFKKTLSLDPNHANGYNNLGTALKDQSKFYDAIDAFKKSLAIKPNFSEASFNLGVVYEKQEKFDRAIECYKRALLSDLKFLDPHIGIGDVLKKQYKFDEAINAFDKALIIQPNSIKTLTKKAELLKIEGNLDSAIDIYIRILNIEPNNYIAHNSIGCIKIDQMKLKEALVIFNKAIAIKSDNVYAYYNIAVIKVMLRNHKEAIKFYEKALSLEPDFQNARAQKLHQQSYIVDWEGIKQDSSLIPQLGISKEQIVPFILLSLDDAPERHKKRAELLNKNRFLQKPLAIDFKVKEEYKPIRVAYFSSDFKEHPVAYLLARVFEKHDRSQFKVYGYSIKATKKDSMHKRLVTAFDEFKDLSDVSDKEAALIAREDGIDIAIDLNGFTENSRTGIFAYRAAPIQINYLGFPGTMGADFIDYIIADEVLIPESSQKFYSEKPIYLPHTYMPTDNTREISTKPITRTEVGLPEDSFVFCCFNNNYKISSEEFDIWMRILGQVANSVLWLRKSNEWSEANFIKEAKKRNIDPSRLIFAGKLDMKEHLARHRLADLFLDTFNFNAHTTASEALWTGLPVVTKMGKGFASRVAASLLNALDCPELITETKEDYEALIMELATDPKKLLRIREKVTSNRLSKPLFNTELYIKNLENSFKQVHENYIHENNIRF
jgi:predicted O-linked N-acetylglucosamine transferase (SPINDLY family)